jgi:CBS domain containing-hemolysin-like protein
VILLSDAVVVAACLAVQAFFAGSEIAMISADRLALRGAADAGDAGARRAMQLLERPARLVGMCLLGANVATITGATVLANAFGHLGGFGGELLVVAVYTPLTVIFAEVIPKSVFLQYANTLAPRLARTVGALQALFTPPLWISERFTRGVLWLAGRTAQDVHRVRREDIQLLLETSETSDIHADEREIIRRVFEFSETLVSEAMVPLIEVVGVPETATCDEAAASMVEHGFSRLPVYRKRVDRVVGIVSHSDLLAASDGDMRVAKAMREVLFVPESTRVDALFVELRRRRQRLAVAVDEYGGAVGLISMEDILEEIVGDIQDEFDRRRPQIRKLGERTWIASGRAEVDVLFNATGFEMPEGEYETLAGFLLARLGHVPQVGERIGWGSYQFTVAQATDRAIVEVEIQRTGTPAGKP